MTVKPVLNKVPNKFLLKAVPLSISHPVKNVERTIQQAKKIKINAFIIKLAIRI